MKYRLKDKALQAKLDEISCGDFSNCLNFFYANFENEPVRIIPFGEITLRDGTALHRFSVTVYAEDVEELQECDPTPSGVLGH